MSLVEPADVEVLLRRREVEARWAVAGVELEPDLMGVLEREAEGVEAFGQHPPPVLGSHSLPDEREVLDPVEGRRSSGPCGVEHHVAEASLALVDQAVTELDARADRILEKRRWLLAKTR